jgi:predicted ATP-binding protein involved in virulence
MYLHQLFLKNVGPINEIDLKPNFNQNGNPKPLILVGKNGGGKSFVLSSIVDAIFEMQKQHFKDVNKDGSYFRLCGGINQKSETNFALAFCEFFGKYQSKETQELKDFKFQYLEKTGKLEKKDDVFKKFELEGVAYEDSEENIKKLCNQSNQESLKSDFLINPYCFFPANRHENPHWLNLNAIRDDKEEFNLDAKFSGVLNKPIYLESTLKQNKNWLMDVILDWHSEKLSNTSIEAIYWNQTVNLLQGILEKQNIRFGIGNRNFGSNRISIVQTNQLGYAEKNLIPSINNLSSGQTVLLNLFLTILRYSDSNPRNLEEIEGIVIIDEVDLHLHIDLQAKILPNLLKLFPKIQFILTSHSPIFLLGMKDVFGEEGFNIFSLPDGRKIGVEDYEEYKKAFEVIKFEEEIEKKLEKIKKEIEKNLENNRPIVFVEGPTDVVYIKKAAKLLGKESTLERVILRNIGNKQGNEGGGCPALDNVAKIIKSDPNIFNKKIILIYDPDCKNSKDDESKNILKAHEDLGIFRNKNKPVGIESLFPKSFIEKADIKFFYKNTCEKGSNVSVNSFKILDDEKQNFCDWACENGTAEDFANFAQIFEIIENVLNNENS